MYILSTIYFIGAGGGYQVYTYAVSTRMKGEGRKISGKINNRIFSRVYKVYSRDGPERYDLYLIYITIGSETGGDEMKAHRREIHVH